MTKSRRHSDNRSIRENSARPTVEMAAAPSQNAAEELQKLARQVVESETSQRAALYKAAKTAAEAAEITSPPFTDLDDLLAKFDPDQVPSHLKYLRDKRKSTNEKRVFHMLAMLAHDAFEDAHLDDAQRHHVLTRLFAVFTKPQLVLPQEAPERYADRADRSEHAVDFIRRVYQPWLGKGLTQAHLGRLDKQLYAALYYWLRTNALPTDLDLPKKSEVVTRQIAATDPATIREARRLETAARRRKR